MPVRLYRSTDASAPVLTGQTGSLVALLDAVLVNGYGATAAAGWTIAFTATSKRVYTMGAGGTGFSLEVDDAGPGAGTFREARVCGVESPTSINTGTNYFPTTGQTAVTGAKLVIRKSATLDATARPWAIIANQNTFYLFVTTGDLTTNYAEHPFMFGDFFTYSVTDVWNCAIIGRVRENTGFFSSAGMTSSVYWDAKGANLAEAFCGLAAVMGGDLTGLYLTTAIPGHFVARSYTGVGGSVPVTKVSDVLAMGYGSSYGNVPTMGYHGSGPNITSSTTWTGTFAYPSPIDSGLLIAPVFLAHNGFRRGYYKGLWNPIQHSPLAPRDTYTGTGNLAGKSMIAMSPLNTSNSTGSTEVNNIAAQCHIEYSDTWN